MATPLTQIVLECSAAMCVVAGAYLLLLLRVWPRVFLRRYPEEVRKAVPPLSPRERIVGIVVSVPFLIALLAFPIWAGYRATTDSDANYGETFLLAYLTWSSFNLFDWLVLD